MTDETAQAPAVPQVLLQKIYIKDASIELPGAPGIFSRNDQPAIDVALNTGATNLGNDHYQVVLTVTVTGKLASSETAFLVEVQQCGIFQVNGFTASGDIEAVLGVFCPNTLFPFAREAVADFTQKAGFPALMLQPVNFEALYMEHRNRREAEAPPAVTH